MTTRPIDTQRLAAERLGKDLRIYVLEKRLGRPVWSWDLIAEELTKDTDGQVDVTGTTLHNWYAQIERDERNRVAS